MRQERRRPPVLLGTDEFDRLPKILYAACQSVRTAGAGLVFELRETTSGQTALMAFSSLPALVAACGTGQSWVRVRSTELAGLRRQLRFDVVALDQMFPAELRHAEVDTVQPDRIPDLEPIGVNGRPANRVYLPSRPVRRGDQEVRLELQPGPNGEPAVLAYFSPEQLSAACGPHQPWVAFPANLVGSVARAAGARTVWFGPALPARARHRPAAPPARTRRTGAESFEEESIYER